MKDAEIKGTLRQLERVWSRVTGKVPPPEVPPPEAGAADALAELIRAEAAAERRCLCMAQRASGANADMLRRLAAGSRGLARKLQTEYYLRTGDSLPVPGRGPENCRSLGEALRLAWLAAGSAERAYLDAAARADDPTLRETLRAAAELKRNQRKTLQTLAGRLLR